MKPEQQIKALAELDGAERLSMGFRNGRKYSEPTPDKSYLASYDAIIPLIQKQTREVRVAMTQTFPRGFVSFMTTPAQLAEALLRATGRWIEL